MLLLIEDQLLYVNSIVSGKSHINYMRQLLSLSPFYREETGSKEVLQPETGKLGFELSIPKPGFLPEHECLEQQHVC